MNAKDFRALTLSELDRSVSTSVWVFNMTGTPEVAGASDNRGAINLSVNDGMGNTIPVKIAATWVPVDLTTQATKASLVANPQFRRLVSSGAIRLVSEEDALSVLMASDAQKESKRIYSLNASAELTLPNEVKDQMIVREGKINPTVISVVQRDDLDEDSSLSALKSNELALTRTDFEYLATNCKHGKVKEWAIEKIV